MCVHTNFAGVEPQDLISHIGRVSSQSNLVKVLYRDGERPKHPL